MRKSQKIVILLSSLSIFIIGLTFNTWFYKELQKQAIEIDQPLVTYQDQTALVNNLQQMIHDAQKSIVQINVKTDYVDREGSGFLYNSRGDIVTNAHVIRDAISIEVTMSNAETYAAAIVGIGTDQDIAVIRVPQLINHHPIELETTERLLPGSEVIAIGSPLGFHNTVTVGIISGVDRSFEINDYNYNNVYQISANITHGNSGGPLIDRQTGKVIGINSAGVEDSDIGFSIPIPTIIDEITDWSTSTTNAQLNFPTTVTNRHGDPDVLSEEARYLIDYFVDSIAINDYINAYTLLGSDIQNEIDYPNFRSQYIHMRDVSIVRFEGSNVIQEAIQLTTTIEYDDTSTQNGLKMIEYSFTVGYENDQLKILNIKKD